jgi:membrane-bound metal-dependent hydrolase YbcI (DUF457 family)
MPSPIGHALAGVAVAWSAGRLAQPATAARRVSVRFTALCAALAMAPDLDLLIQPTHRTVTHSVGAVALVFIVAIAVTGWVRRGRVGLVGQVGQVGQKGRVGQAGQGEVVQVGAAAARARKEGQDGQERQGAREAQHRRATRVDWGVAFVCTAAYASHLLLDWLGSDPSWPTGIQALWPFSHRWFISGWNLFPYIERREMLSSTSIIINTKAIAGEVAILGPVVGVLGLWRWGRKAESRINS